MSAHEDSSSGASLPEVFYLPFMHAALAGPNRPEEVVFLNPGLLPETGQAAEKIHTPESLPLLGRTAQRFLADLLAEGASLGSDALSLAWPDRTADVLAASVQAGMSAAERKALADFAATAQYIPATGPGGDVKTGPADRLIQAQKLLLLAYELEEAALSARALGEVVSGHERALRDLLRSDNDAGAEIDLPGTEVKVSSEDILERSLSRWRDVLRCWQCFLPLETVFYTDDFSVLPGLDVSAARPLDEARAEKLFPSRAGAGGRFLQIQAGTEQTPVLLISEDLLVP